MSAAKQVPGCVSNAAFYYQTNMPNLCGSADVVMQLRNVQNELFFPIVLSWSFVPVAPYLLKLFSQKGQ